MFGVILWWLTLLSVVDGQDLDFDLLAVQVPWPSGTHPHFRDWSHFSGHPAFSPLYSYLQISEIPSSLWAVYGGWTGIAEKSITEEGYPALNYLELPNPTDVWISTTEGQKWINATDAVPKIYLHVYCGNLGSTSNYFNKFQRGWIPSMDPEIVSKDPQRIHYVAWELLVTQFFDAKDKKSCLGPDIEIYYTLDKERSMIGAPISNGGFSSIGIPWYQIDSSQIFRNQVITGIHHNNSDLGGRRITYILGGTVNQPDYREHHLRDIWASSNYGQDWIPIKLDYPWSSKHRPSSLGISNSGLMVVNVDYGELADDSDLWLSLDGGRSWECCRHHAPYGGPTGEILAFDSQGYLYIIGGRRPGQDVQETWKSQISFNDLEAVGRKCQAWSSLQGIGLSRWNIEKESTPLRLRPSLGLPHRHLLGFRVWNPGYWQIGLVVTSIIVVASALCSRRIGYRPVL